MSFEHAIESLSKHVLWVPIPRYYSYLGIHIIVVLEIGTSTLLNYHKSTHEFLYFYISIWISIFLSFLNVGSDQIQVFGHLLITYMIYPWAITDLCHAITLHIMFQFL